MHEAALEIVREIARMRVYSPDSNGNIACVFCGYYLQFSQPDGERAGVHKKTCLYQRSVDTIAGTA